MRLLGAIDYWLRYTKGTYVAYSSVVYPWASCEIAGDWQCLRKNFGSQGVTALYLIPLINEVRCTGVRLYR